MIITMSLNIDYDIANEETISCDEVEGSEEGRIGTIHGFFFDKYETLSFKEHFKRKEECKWTISQGRNTIFITMRNQLRKKVVESN